MRTLGIALEAYASEHRSYPPMVPMREAVEPELHKRLKATRGFDLSTLAIYQEASIPIDAIPGVCLHWARVDYPYRQRGVPLPYAYYQAGREWIVFAPGPDRVYDIEPNMDCGTGGEESRKRLTAKQYDATNGTKSAGDLWRTNR